MSTLFPLSVKGATTARRGQVLVGPVDLEFDDPGVSVVIGPNGAGKTSLLRLLHGTARLSRGQINWACSTEEARHHQAFVFQRPIMLRRTVEKNLMYPLLMRGMTKAEARDAARFWAKRVGLNDALDRSATVLSGGEQQKLSLARALIAKPQLLFLDEPCSSLDGRSMREIEEILVAARDDGTRLIFSTHDMGQARRLANDVLFMLGGKVHERQEARTFFHGPKTPEARAFLQGDIVE